MLSKSDIGKTYVVTAMDLPDRIQRRMEALGLTLGTPLTVLNSKGKGILIVKFRGTRFALGNRITEKIEVEAV